MSSSPSPVFGKRSIVRTLPGAAPVAGPSLAGAAPDEHAAFFAAVRAELDDSGEDRRMVVPRSFKAAFLAGLVVGCALAGFDVTAAEAPAAPSPFATIAAALGSPMDTTPLNLAPVTILLGLFGGARIAATTMIVVHTLLNWADCSSRTAYAIGGAAVSTAIAAALLVGLGHQPAHGWVIELSAGAAGSLLYRVFAGRRATTKS